MIEEIEEMMQNSPDPEEELDEDDNDLEEISTHSDSILLQEMQALSKTFNNNWTAEGKAGPPTTYCHCILQYRWAVPFNI